MDLDVLKVKFTHSNTVRDRKPYTIYEIEVRSSSTITWVIYKRYSAFYQLHQDLTKAQLTDPQIKAAALPHLPPKRLTRSLAAEFVEKRKSELQEYLKAILKIPALLHSSIIMMFLEVPDSVKPMLLGAGQQTNAKYMMPDGKDIPDSKESQLNAKNLQNKSPEERRVLELLNLLKYHPNRVSAIKSFEEWFFDQKPRLSPDMIRQLFQGKGGEDGEGGLIQTCGDFTYSNVASRAALYLLCRLLDVEKNKDAQMFLDVFCGLDTSVLRKMKLDLHILSERGNRLGAFRIVAVLHSANGTVPSNNKGQPQDLSVESMVADVWARKEYHTWAERKTDQVAPFVNEPQNNVLKSLSLTDVNYKSIAQQARAELAQIIAEEKGFRRVFPVGMGEVKETEAPEVQIMYRKDPVKDAVILKILTVLPFHHDTVATLLADMKRRKDWDPKFHTGRRVQKLDADSDVVHMVFKSFSSPYKYRDFCMLRSKATLEKGGGISLVGRSILHPGCGEVKDNVRAVLYPTGYTIVPLKDVKPDTSPQATAAQEKERKEKMAAEKKSDSKSVPPATKPAPTPAFSLLTFVAQLDRESVLIVSPDLLGETDELRDSILNIKAVLSKDYETAYGSLPPIVPKTAYPKPILDDFKPGPTTSSAKAGSKSPSEQSMDEAAPPPPSEDWEEPDPSAYNRLPAVKKKT